MPTEPSRTERVKGSIYLLVAGIVVAALAAAFTKYLGAEGSFSVFITVVLVATVIDNFQLRRKLRKLYESGRG